MSTISKKIILDGLNPLKKTNKATRHKELWQKGLYEDDKQVVEAHIYKKYGEVPKVIISAEEI